jgi:hypothetical protein
MIKNTNRSLDYLLSAQADVSGNKCYVAFAIKTVDNTYVFSPITNYMAIAGSLLLDVNILAALNNGDNITIDQVVNNENCSVRYAPYFIPKKNGGANVTLGARGCFDVGGCYMVAVPKSNPNPKHDQGQNIISNNISLLNRVITDHSSTRSKITSTLVVRDLVNNKYYRCLTPRFSPITGLPDVGSLIANTSPYIVDLLNGKQEGLWESPVYPGITATTYVKSIGVNNANNQLVALMASGFDANLSVLTNNINGPLKNAMIAAQNTLNQLFVPIKDENDKEYGNVNAESQFGIGCSASYFVSRRLSESQDLSNNATQRMDKIRLLTTVSEKASSMAGLPADASLVPGSGAGTVYPLVLNQLNEFVYSGRKYQGFNKIPGTNIDIFVYVEPVFDNMGGIVAEYGLAWDRNAYKPGNPPSQKHIENAVAQCKLAVGHLLSAMNFLKDHAAIDTNVTLWVKQRNSVHGVQVPVYVSGLSTHKDDHESGHRDVQVLDNTQVIGLLDSKTRVVVNNNVICGQLYNSVIDPITHVHPTLVTGAIEYGCQLKSHTQ